MSRKFQAWLASLPPIDWAFLAATRPRPMGKGDKHTTATIEKIRRARLAILARERKARAIEVRATMEPLPRLTAWRRMPPHGYRVRDQIAQAMEPGHWYGRIDIRDATGLPWGSVRARVADMVREGTLQKARAPDAVYPDPVFLYSLTPAGEAFRVRSFQRKKENAGKPTLKSGYTQEDARRLD